jgi:hypothetical protein
METFANVVLPWTYAFKKTDKSDQDGGANGGNLLGLIVSIIAVVVGIYAGYLCWKCNEKEDLGLKVVYTCVAFFNAIPYLIYYLAIRVIIGAPCKCCGTA